MQKPKKSGLPHKWPHSSPKDLMVLPNRVVNIGFEQEYLFKSNVIKTSKYEWYNFLPKFILEEFDPNYKIANCYFLIIAGMQCIPQISNTNGYPTTLIPLLVVLIFSGIFKGMEDNRRHKADKDANSSLTERYSYDLKKFETVLWSEIQVGDLIRVGSRQVVSADMLILQASEPNPENRKGLCFVETKSLDGETNLKQRNVIPCLLHKMPANEEDLQHLYGEVAMEHPNNLIDSFSGVLQMKNEPKFAILPINVILRGCVVRSTKWVIGLVLNTGHDVKIMQINLKPVIKSSNLEANATRQVIGVIILLLAICLGGSVGNVIFIQTMDIKHVWYLNWTYNPGIQFVVQFFYELLLHSSFIPVSLYVSMILVRSFQSFFMISDLDMYYEKLDIPANVRTMTLNEELGQISHIFSDKTGTLTCNNMNFRKASVNGVSYGQGITEIGRAAWKLLGKQIPEEVLMAEKKAIENAVDHVAFYCPDYERDMAETSSPGGLVGESKSNIQHHHVHSREVKTSTKSVYRDDDSQVSKHTIQKRKNQEFFRFLSVCNEVVAEHNEGQPIKLSAPNPDDEALVCAAAYFGYSFIDRRDDIVLVEEKVSQSTLQIPILYTIPFTSSRKRMSVIIRDVDNKIKIICKGADNAILARIDDPKSGLVQKTAEDLNRFSVEGLRCLVMAAAVISDEKFNDWRLQYDAALTDLNELDKRKQGEPNRIDQLEDLIERNLSVVGATAIEDRLQDGVPECIEKLTQAGIKIWVLTGDKEETAINIAVACSLVLPQEYMYQVIINHSTAPNIASAIDVLSMELEKLKKESLQFNQIYENHDSNHVVDDENPGPGMTELTILPSKQSVDSHNKASSPQSNASVKPRALIIDGPSLIFIMTDARARDVLLEFSQKCQAVVCCRVSPDQKREVVDLVKLNVPGVQTLAIGDGANDVAMITTAHVGVGIKGEEGVQAVNAADYSLGQFRFLSTLLLRHGRYNYIRMSNLVNYMFYKNIYMSTSMFWYTFFVGSSGTKFYTEAAIQFYNLFYTSVPILLYGAYDRDLSQSTCAGYSQLYRFGITDEYFNTKKFWMWVGSALIDSVLAAVLPLYLLSNFEYDKGVSPSYKDAGNLAFTVVIFTVNQKMFLIQSRWFGVSILILILSFGTWIGVAYIVDSLYLVDFDYFHSWDHLLRTGTFWLSFLLIVVAISIKDLAFMAYRRFYHPRLFHILQEIEKFGLKSTGNQHQIVKRSDS